MTQLIDEAIAKKLTELPETLRSLPSEKEIAQTLSSRLENFPGTSGFFLCTPQTAGPQGNDGIRVCSTCPVHKQTVQEDTSYPCRLIDNDRFIAYPLDTQNAFYGHLLIQLAEPLNNRRQVEQYNPFIHSLCYSLALMLENRRLKNRLDSCSATIRENGWSLIKQRESLWKITTLIDSDLHTICDSVLGEISALTQSPYGFYGFVDEKESVLNIQSWSSQAVKDCRVHNKPIRYPIFKAGIWADAVRKRKIAVFNDYNAEFLGKRGTPEGHITLTRVLSVPIFSGGKIVALGAVANKETPYTGDDIEVLNTFLHNIQILVDRKYYEQKLKDSLREKDTLLRELYHRTKNNMQVISSMLSVQASYSSSPGIKEIFRDTQNRIQVMALAHQKLYQSQNLSRIQLDNYIHDLATYLIHRFHLPPGKISLEFQLEPASVLIDTAIPCGLVTCELISNAVKHAFPGGCNGEIRLRLNKSENGELHLIISDNGIGTPENFDFNKQTTMGIKTMIAIAENQLQGAITFKNQKGVTCDLQFNDNLYEERV